MNPTAPMRLSESLRRVEAEIAASRPDLALALCQEVQARYPRALAVHRVLGEIYLALRKPREALGALDRALTGDPEDARACCARAIVHQMHGDSLAALAWYRRACDIRPDDAVLRSTYGELARHLGQPTYRPTRVGLARLYLRGGLLTHATREWEMLITEYPDLLEAQVGLAETLWRANRLPEAMDRCRRITTNAPACVKALLLLALMSHDTGNSGEARRLVQRAAEFDPDQRIGHALFADRLVVGDQAIRDLLEGASQDAGDLAAGAAGRSVSRPLRTRRPLTGQLGWDVLGMGQPAASSQPLTPMAAPSAGASGDARSAFSEAEYMIWGPDEEARSRSAPRPALAGESARPDANAGVPPASLHADDAEAPAATSWVRWLRAQGARAQAGLSPQDAPQASPQTPSARPPAPSRPVERTPRPWAEIAVPPGGMAGQAADVGQAFPRATGPLPPPTAEALRSMFAELAPAAGTNGHDVVEADMRPIYDAEVTERVEAFARGSGAVAEPDATIEELERQFAASGFHQLDPQPGVLAALAASPDAVVPPAPAAPAAEEPPALVAPAPDDYVGRLDYARRLRDDGKAEEALAEYRAVLKNAPDLLDAVLGDLNESLAATPEDPGMHRLLGDARIVQGDYLGALEAYNRAVALSHSGD